VPSALGQDHSVTSRIVGGTAAAEGAWPSTVALVSPGTNFFIGQFCAGTIVHKDWVLTASHCVENLSASQVRILTGVTDLITDTPREIIQVAQIIRHPSYNPQTLNFDFALLKLKTSTSMPRSRLYAGNSTLTGVISTAVGWGATNPFGSAFPPNLMQVNLPIVSNAACSSANDQTTTANMLCAGRISGGVDACNGDSGGPLFINLAGSSTQVGVTSFGFGLCATSGKYGVWARVSKGISFVLQHVPGKISQDGLYFIAENGSAAIAPVNSILLN